MYQEIRVGFVAEAEFALRVRLPVTWNHIIELVAQSVDLPVGKITLVYGGRQFVFDRRADSEAWFPEPNPKVFLVRPRNRKTFPSRFGVKPPPEDDEDTDEKKPWTTTTDNLGREIIVID